MKRSPRRGRRIPCSWGAPRELPGGSREDAIAVDLRTHKTAWTIKSVDSEPSDVQLLADDRTLYVLRGKRLKAYPLT